MKTSEITALRLAVVNGEYGSGLEAQMIVDLCAEVERLSDIIFEVMQVEVLHSQEGRSLAAEEHLTERQS